MKVVIIEDEKLSADLLQRLLIKLDDQIEIVALIDSVKKSIELFQNGLQSDLIFCDIHLADGLSFDIFSEVIIDTPIIFTTAYSEYAIKAFEVNSIDYLLKPIGIDDLNKALEKFKKYGKVDNQLILENFSNAYHQLTKQYKSRFMVKIGTNIGTIKIEDVVHFTTQDGLTFLVTQMGKRYPLDYTLDQLELMLSPESFFRINRKVILSIQSIDKVSTYFNSRLVVHASLLDGESAIVSRDRVGDFKSWLDR